MFKKLVIIEPINMLPMHVEKLNEIAKLNFKNTDKIKENLN